MSPEERDRLLRLELNAENQAMSVDRISDKVDRLDGKVDDLLKAAHMGQGAWWLMLRVGAVITAVISAAVWIFDRFSPHK